MKANRCPVWTPLYWHRRLLHEYIVKQSSQFILSLRKHFAGVQLQVLDAGCGSQPYRDAFTGSKEVNYIGADVPWAGIQPDVTIDAKSQRIFAPDASFHGLVHFQSVGARSRLCSFSFGVFPSAKTRGIMFCTVPFAFEFHPVPGDYRRWTHEG